MSEHHWLTRWQGHEYVMDDNGRLIRTTDGESQNLDVNSNLMGSHKVSASGPGSNLVDPAKKKYGRARVADELS
jgi:hypothetical protein